MNAVNYSNNFFNQLSSSGYMPLITKPTRITKSTATLIDNIFTKNANKTGHQSGILLNNISDHLPIFTITSPVPELSFLPAPIGAEPGRAEREYGGREERRVQGLD